MSNKIKEKIIENLKRSDGVMVGSSKAHSEMTRRLALLLNLFAQGREAEARELAPYTALFEAQAGLPDLQIIYSTVFGALNGEIVRENLTEAKNLVGSVLTIMELVGKDLRNLNFFINGDEEKETQDWKQVFSDLESVINGSIPFEDFKRQ
jgi:hypothetical protein